MSRSGILDFLYLDDRDRLNPLAALGAALNPPPRFDHGQWHVVAKLHAETDGHEVRVSECRMPARFYKVEALSRINHRGEFVPGFAFSTGSGDEMGELAASIALAISNGMLGMESER